MEKVKISKDGNSIDFVRNEMPSNPKKFRASAEIEGFYRFVYENDLRKEALEIIEKTYAQRKAAKAAIRKAGH